MRKHFLLLFLMALLPLAGWAATDVTVTPVTFTKPYGFSEAVTVNMFTCSPAVSNDEKALIAARLTLVRIDQGQDVNTAEGYRYYFEKTGDTENSTIFIAPTEGRLRISKLNLNAPGQNKNGQDIQVNVTLDPNADVSWTGQAIEPNVTVSISNLDIAECNGVLTENTHYTLTISQNVEPSSHAVATVAAIDNTNFTGTKVVNDFFTVGKPSIQNAVVTFKSTFAPTFTGKPITVQASDIDKVIVQYPNMEPQELATTEWEIVANGYENNVEAADKTAENAPKVKLQGTNDHEGTIMVPFTIAPATDINIVTFNDINALTYTGKTAEPVVTAYIDVNNNQNYDNGTDYDVDVANEFTLATTNKDVTDQATVTVTGKGKNFATAATKVLNYVINPFDLANAERSIENVQYSAAPQEVKPVLTIGTGNDAITIPETSYTLSYKDADGNAQNSENYNVTKIQNGIKVVAAANASTNYTGSTPAFDDNDVIKYNITAKDITITAAEFTVGHGADLPVSVSMDETTLVGNDTWALLTAGVDLTNTEKYKFYNDNNGEKGDARANNEVPTDKGFYWYELKVGALTSATAGNYAITPVAARFEITTAQVIARVKTKNDVVYGTNAASWDLEYVSGLGTSQAAATAFATIKAGLNFTDANFAFVDQTLNCTPTTAAWLNVVEGNGYEVKYTGTQTYGNYQVSVQNGYLKPVAKELNAQAVANTYDVAIQINGDQAITYAGAVPAQTTGWTATYNNEDVKNQLNIAYDENFNVGDRTALVTPKAGNLNFVATREVEELVNNVNTNVTHNDRPVAYSIGKADLEIAADPKPDWVYGSPNNSALSFTATGLVGADEGIDLSDATVAAAHGFTGTVHVDIVGSDGVGTHTNALVPTGITASVNYNVQYSPATLTVAKNTVTVKIKDQTITYGNAPAAFELEVVSDNITDEQKASINQIVNWSNATNYDADEMKDVRMNGEAYGYYEITATNADAATATNYTVNEILPGKLTIQKRPVTFTAKSWVDEREFPTPGQDNRIAYGNLTAWLANLAVSPTFIDVTTGSIANDATYNHDETITDLITSIAPKTTIIGVDNVLELTKTTAGVAANYDITTINGVLQLTDGGVEDLKFTSVDADLAQITNFNGVVKKVKINFAPRNAHRGYGADASETYPWEKEMWTTMVLPFDISVADLSKVLGYAIVNVINPDKTVVSGTGSKFYGKLTMKGGNGYHAGEADADTKLAANKPFLLKLADDIKILDGEDPYYYDFGPQTIINPADEAARTVDAGGDCRFVGTYTAKTVTKDDEAAIWFMNGNEDGWQYIGSTSSSSWSIVPFEAYIDMNALPLTARNMTFYVEDIDGTVTAINGITNEVLGTKLNADGWYTINGMKLQSAPIEKGIYINNGKKIVIK